MMRDETFFGIKVLIIIILFGGGLIYNAIKDGEHKTTVVELTSLMRYSNTNLNLSFGNNSYFVSLSNDYLDDLELKTGNVYRLNMTRCLGCFLSNNEWGITDMKLLKEGNKSTC